MDILEMYYIVFGEYPPLTTTKTYTDEFYQELMKKALEIEEPISAETLNRALGNEEYDVEIEKTFNNFKKGE